MLAVGFMMAESAVIGRRTSADGWLMSIMTTWFCSPTFSLTQMYLSDSIVSVLKPILAAPIPRVCNYVNVEYLNVLLETDGQQVSHVVGNWVSSRGASAYSNLRWPRKMKYKINSKSVTPAIHCSQFAMSE